MLSVVMTVYCTSADLSVVVNRLGVVRGGYQEHTAGALQLLHGPVQVCLLHVGELLHPAGDQEALEARYARLEQRPQIPLRRTRTYAQMDKHV